MNRRRFVSLLGIGAAVATAAPVLKLMPPPVPIAEPIVATIGEWCDYSDYSEFTLQEAIDKHTAQAAQELGYQAGLSLNTVFQYQ